MATALPKHFIEIAAVAAAVRVDRENGIIRSVKIIGLTSRNGRRYLPEALRRAVGLYEGCRVFLNHPRRAEQGDDRKFQDWVGVLRGVQFTGDGLVGDLHLRRESTYFSELCESAEMFGDHFGLSHVADGDSHMENGVEVITAINEVNSVDVVTDPATTRGLFESSRFKDVGGTELPIKDAADNFIVNALRDIILACHGGQHDVPLTQHIAELHVIANEYRNRQGKATAGGIDQGKISAINQCVDRLDAILNNPTQVGVIEMAEAELLNFANIIHGRDQGGSTNGVVPSGVSEVDTSFGESVCPQWKPWMEKTIDPFDPNFAAKVRERNRFQFYMSNGY